MDTRPTLPWFSRVFGLDGIMPIFVLLFPMVAQNVFLLPDHQMISISVILSILAMVTRVLLGEKALAANQVGPFFRGCQKVVFVLGLLVLLLLEIFVIILHFIPPAPPVPIEVLGILAGMYLVYLAAMTFAMFPGWGDPWHSQEDFTMDQD